MEFVQHMDNQANRRTIPSKPGTMVRATVGHDQRAALLELWTMLKRGTSDADISSRVKEIIRSCAPSNGVAERTQLLTLLCRLIVQKRDCRNGGGEKDVTYSAIVALRQALPETSFAIVKLLPTFGYFKDLTLIATRAQEANDKALVAACVAAIACAVQSRDVLACKWAPRENKATSWLAEKVRRKLSMRAKTYRKHLSKVMAENAVNVPEVLMSAKRFREIEPEKVPSRCLKVHRRAFLDEDKKGQRRHVEDNDPDLADRELCRRKFEETIKAGKALNGSQNFPYELVADVRKNGVPSDMQRQTMNSMWKSIVENVKKQIAEQKAKDAAASSASSASSGETKVEKKEIEAMSFDPSLMVPMSDVSGSMTCCNEVPMNNSIAMGLLLAEVGHPAFRGRVLTFHSTPSWVVFDATEDFVSRVQKLAQAPWGGSTNFEAAMGLIAAVVREHRLTEDQIPGITCFSDMKFDAANCSRGGYGSTGNSWNTHYERIQALFANIGTEITGKPYMAPRICFWDLANSSSYGGSGQPGFPVTSNDQGVQMISGFSPALLKLVMTGKRLDTPWETFLKAVTDDRYDEVEKVALQAKEIDPAFVAAATAAVE